MPKEPAPTALLNLTKRVAAAHGRAAQYELANALFTAKTPKIAFDLIKESLADAANSRSNCYYCERDRFRDIEHIIPKAHRPDLSFDWNNYAYACVICNQSRKKSHYAVIDNADNIHEYKRRLPDDEVYANGQVAFISPRKERPLNFFHLELMTGVYLPYDDLDSRSKKRTIFTLRTLGLNDADLTRKRRNAIFCFREIFKKLHLAKTENDTDALEDAIDLYMGAGFPSVAAEIWRQRDELADEREAIETANDVLLLDSL